MTSTEAVASSDLSARRFVIPRWDQQLRAAKNQSRPVRFQLAVETYYADAQCCIEAYVLETDKSGIKVSTVEGVEYWISKAFVVSTEVLDAE